MTVSGDAQRDRPGYLTQQEAEDMIRWHERNRCACGGSPLALPPAEQMHLATCTAIRDFERKHGRYPWE